MKFPETLKPLSKWFFFSAKLKIDFAIPETNKKNLTKIGLAKNLRKKEEANIQSYPLRKERVEAVKWINYLVWYYMFPA